MESILVVDDDRDVVELVQEMIGRRHTVAGTTSGEWALARITAGGVWLLITDIRMPGVNGFQLIRRAKAVAPHLAVVVVSAYYDDTEPLARQVVERYADLAMAKPLNARALNNAIEGLSAGTR